MGNLTTEFGVQQRSSLIKSLTDLDGYDLGNGYQVAVNISAYKPNFLKQLWNGHHSGQSVDLFVEKNQKQLHVHSVKVWDYGFDSAIRIGLQYYARTIEGSFPYEESSIRGEDAIELPKIIIEDAAKIAQKDFIKNTPVNHETPVL